MIGQVAGQRGGLRSSLRRLVTRRWAALVLVLSVAALARGAHVAFVLPDLLADRPMGDALSYDEWGARIAGGDWLGSEVFYQDPGYPYFLGTLYSIFGRSHTAVLVVQALLGVLTVLLVALVAGRLFGGGTAFVAGLLAALADEALFYEGQLQKEVLVGLSMALFLNGLLSALSATGAWKAVSRAAVAGALLGLVCLNRGNAFFFVPVVPLFFLQRGRGPGLPAARIAAFVIGAGLALAPCLLRNRVVAGEWVLTTAQSGPNFYIGNNPRATGLYVPLVPYREMPVFEGADARALAERDEGRSLSAKEVDRYWWARGFDFVRENPLRFIELFARKMGLFLVAEAADTIDIATYRDLSPVLRLSPVRFALLAPLFLAAVPWLLWRRRRSRALIALYGACLVSVGLFYFFSRYRYVVYPILLVSVAALVSRIIEVVRERRWRTLVPALGGILVASLLVHAPFLHAEDSRGTGHLNRGIRMSWRGDHEGAVRAYQRALELNPALAQARIYLGGSLQKLDRHPEAILQFQAARGAPEFGPEAWYALAFSLVAAERREEALRELDALLARHPDHVGARALRRELEDED